MSPVGWLAVGTLMVGGAVGLLYFQYERDKQRTKVKQPKVVGNPMVGGPYELVDDTGKKRGSSDFQGKYPLIYFGFTFCPDICPLELRKMEKALKILDEQEMGDLIQPVYISVDPRRDTPARLNEYKKDYDPRLVWLTGTTDQIEKVAKSFRVYYSAPQVPEGSDMQYLVDHSIFFYLMDREGKFMSFYGKNYNAEEIAAKIRGAIQEDLLAHAK